MKITEFLLKRIVGSTDCLIGFDKDGQLIRISIADLKTSLGVSKVAAESITVQYSLDKLTWHTTFAEGDRYMRVKCGTGAWSDAICIIVSAYETWKEKNGGTGTEAQFLASIKGEAGKDADITQLELDKLRGYSDLLAAVNTSITENNSGILDRFATLKSEVSNTISEIKTMVTNSQVDKLQSVRALSDSDALSIKTADGMRQISLDTLLDNLAVKMASKNGLQRMAEIQRKVFSFTTTPDGKTVNFTTANAFVVGTSQLYINGERLVAGSDYIDNSSTSITFLTHIPTKDDVMVFIAVSA